MGVIFSAFLFFSVKALNDRTGEALDERRVIAEVIADRMNAQLLHAEHMLISAETSELLDLNDGTLEPESRLLRGLFNYTVIFKRINLLDSNGNVILTEPYEKYMMGENLTKHPYNFPLAGNTEPFFYTSIGYRSKKPGTAIIIPIKSQNEDISGYLYGWLDFSNPRAAALLFPYNPGLQGFTKLIDNKGMVLISTDDQSLEREHAQMINSLIEKQKSVVGTCSSCHHLPDNLEQDNILAFAPLSIVPWGLALYQPEAEVFASTYTLAYRLIALGSVVFIALVGAIWFMTREIIDPLQELTNSCQAIAAGDLTHPVPIIGVAETVSLGNSFEEMRKSLAIHQEAMEIERRHLEERVAERTSELVQNRDYLLHVNHNLNTLNSMASILAHSLDLDITLRSALNQVVEITSADAAGIYILDDHGQGFRLAAHYGIPADILLSIQRVDLPKIIVWKDEEAARAGLPSWCDTCSQVVAERLDLPTFVCIPLYARGATPGSLFVSSCMPDAFSSEDRNLLQAMGWQILMAVHNAKLFKNVQRKEKERAEMLRHAINAQEEERKRIARELHDETSQTLASLLLGLDTLETAQAFNYKEAVEIQESLKGVTRQMLANIKRITSDLRPSLLDDLGLIPAVSWYGEQRMKKLGIRLQLETRGFQNRRLPSEIEITLFRITQEALTNVTRHANATEVNVILEHRETEVFLCISDNGRGFDAQLDRPVDYSSPRLGLHGIRERLDLLGGEFNLFTQTGKGTTITALLPLAEGEVYYFYDPLAPG
jgi:signal transduction histidine kinase